MTTRIKGFVVTLAEDLRADDAEEIRLALAMVRGVVSVLSVETDTNDHMNRERVRSEMTNALLAALRRSSKESP